MFLFGPPNVEKLQAKRDVAGLLKALDYQKDIQVPIAAARALGEVRAVEAITRLGALLNHADSALQATAARALGQIGTEAAIQPLTGLLFKAGGNNAEVAAAALIQIGAPVVPVLQRELEQNLGMLTHVRRLTLDILWQLDRSAAEKSLMTLLRNPKVRQVALESLDQWNWQPPADENGALYWFLKGDEAKCLAIGEPAIPLLVNLLANESDQNAAMQALVTLGLPAFPALLEVINNPKAPQRIAALKAVVSMDDVVHMALAEAMNGKGYRDFVIREINIYFGPRGPLVLLRLQAIESLVHYGSRAVPSLAAELNNADPVMRHNAALALGEIKVLSAVPALLAALQHSDAQLRLLAVVALGKILQEKQTLPSQNKERRAMLAMALGRSEEGNPEAVSLLTALQDPEPEVQQAAIKVIGEIGNEQGHEPLVEILHDLHSPLRLMAVRALGQMGKLKNMEVLQPFLQDSDLQVRRAMVEVWGQIGQPKNSEVLLPVLEDPDPDVRLAAVVALVKTGNAKSVDPLLARLADSDLRVRQTVVAGLVRHPAKRVVEPLLGMLRDPEVAVRLEVVKALSNFNQPSVIEALTALLAELSPLEAWARETALALKRLEWQPTGDAAGLHYWAALREWEKCAQFGNPAVPVLLAALQSISEDSEQWSIGMALGKLYRFGWLTAESKALLFTQWSRLRTLRSRSQVNERTVEHYDGNFTYASAPGWSDIRHYDGDMPYHRDGLQTKRLEDFGEPNVAEFQTAGNVEALLGVLRYEDVALRSAAARALGELGRPEVQAALREMMAEERDDTVRSAIQQALERLENPEAGERTDED